MPKLEYKNFKSSISADDEGVIEAYVSVFGNVDLAHEIIEPGAFNESLQSKLPKGVWAHNWEKPIAKTLEAREDEKGLYVKGKLIMDVQQAKEAYALLKEGVVDEFSIGYQVDEDSVDEKGIRHLKKLTLFEWSPVLVGANRQTELISLKSISNEQGLKAELTKEEDLKSESLREYSIGQGIFVIIGKDNDDQLKIQSYKFTGSDWLQEKADQWLKEMSGEVGEAVVSALTDRLKMEKQKINKIIAQAKNEGVKVESQPDDEKKIVRIRQATKQIDKSAEFILRIIKS